MEYVTDLADPLVDIRDVVDSFRSSHLTLPDWDQTLRRVVTALSQLPPQAQVDVVLPSLVPNLRLLLTAGLDNVPQVVDVVAAQVAAALEQTRVPGITVALFRSVTARQLSVSRGSGTVVTCCHLLPAVAGQVARMARRAA
jgi:hypothetical protein